MQKLLFVNKNTFQESQLLNKGPKFVLLIGRQPSGFDPPLASFTNIPLDEASTDGVLTYVDFSTVKNRHLGKSFLGVLTILQICRSQI